MVPTLVPKVSKFNVFRPCLHPSIPIKNHGQAIRITLQKKKNVAIEHLPFIVPFIDDVLLNTIWNLHFTKDFPATVDYHYTTFSQIIIPPFFLVKSNFMVYLPSGYLTQPWKIPKINGGL